MLWLRVSYLSYGLLLMVSINLFHHIPVTESQSTSKRNQVLGIPKNLKKDKQNVTTISPKVKKDIESETQRAIDEIVDIEVTTLTIDSKEAANNTINETIDTFEANSTSNQSLLMFNETEITTPLFHSNISTNDSKVMTIIDETPDYINSTEYQLLLNLTTHLSTNSTTITSLTTITPNITDNITNPTHPSEPLHTEVTDTLHESPIFSSTVSSVEALTDSSIDSNIGLREEMTEKCVFDNQIECKNYELICYGSGEVDCGQRGKRDAQSLTLENRTDPEVFKSYLEKQSLSETIINSKCVLTPLENMYFSCDPFPLLSECRGTSLCRPAEEESSDLSEGMPFWKVGLVAALTAIGFICFIIVAVIGYVSYNKLKVRPESSTNGYQSNPQNVTRV